MHRPNRTMTERRRASGLVFGYVYPFLFAVVLNLAARGETIFGPLYSIDTYGQGFQPFVDPGLYNWSCPRDASESCRCTGCGTLLGYMGAGVAVSALMMAVLLFAHSGLLFAQVILRRPTALEMTLFLALFTLHPFITEFFHFTDATMVIALAIWLASVGPVRRGQGVPDAAGHRRGRRPDRGRPVDLPDGDLLRRDRLPPGLGREAGTSGTSRTRIVLSVPTGPSHARRRSSAYPSTWCRSASWPWCPESRALAPRSFRVWPTRSRRSACSPASCAWRCCHGR